MTSKPLRIAMLGHKRIPSREGGVEIVVRELSVRMAAKGHAVTCYNRRGTPVGGASPVESTMEACPGVRILSVPTINIGGLAALSASFFAALRCAFGRYDVVHFHAEGYCAMLWLPKLFGKYCVATIHGLDHQRAKWQRFASAYILLGEKTAARYADEIIVLSENVKDYFQTTYGRKTVFIPNAVSPPELKPADLTKEPFALSKDEYFLFLGRLVPEKGLCNLIDAFANVRTDKKLVIAGGDSNTAAFAAALKSRAKDDPRVVFTGFVQGELLRSLYANAFVYVLPSELEGMPLSLLEAMSYGNCCLVSDIEECVSVVQDKAVTFRCRDTKDLTEKLQMLADSPEIVAGYRQSAANYILEKYNWDDVVTRTLQCYERSVKQ